MTEPEFNLMLAQHMQVVVAIEAMALALLLMAIRVKHNMKTIPKS